MIPNTVTINYYFLNRAQDGLLAALQVKPSYKRKGFGAIIVKEFSRLEAEQGRDIITEVGSENEPSLNLFKKLGFMGTQNCTSRFQTMSYCISILK